MKREDKYRRKKWRKLAHEVVEEWPEMRRWDFGEEPILDVRRHRCHKINRIYLCEEHEAGFPRFMEWIAVYCRKDNSCKAVATGDFDKDDKNVYIGGFYLSPFDRHVPLYDVPEELKRKGVGSHTYFKLEEFFRRRGAKEICLYPLATARGFWGKMGFERRAQRSDDWCKSLSPPKRVRIK